jgi:hypothetical protein
VDTTVIHDTEATDKPTPAEVTARHHRPDLLDSTARTSKYIQMMELMWVKVTVTN